MAKPEVHAKFQWAQIGEIDRALKTMRAFGILEGSGAYQALLKTRGALFGKMGFRIPRPVSLLAKLIGLSPGEIKIWHDAESGWMAEARAEPGSPPIYRAVGDEVAVAILKREVTPELERWLMTPDPYVGE